MKYNSVVEAKFISRPNRFIAKVELLGEEITVHVKNTGRCRELLVPGATVYLARGDGAGRKTPYDLIATKKVCGNGKTLLINMDSQCPNALVSEWLPRCGMFSPDAVIRREVTLGDSRFDIYIEDGPRRAFIEVKGVTLEEDGVAMFPDAPTLRGVKHLSGLSDCISLGYEAYVFFVIQMKGVNVFKPNRATHAAFADALLAAKRSGVKILAYDTVVSHDELYIDEPVTVDLGE